MKSRPFFALSLFCAIVAFGLQVASRHALEQGMKRRATIIQKAALEHIKVEPDLESSRYFQTARSRCYIGFAFTACAVAALVGAVCRREPAWYLILIGMLLLGIVTPMLL